MSTRRQRNNGSPLRVKQYHEMQKILLCYFLKLCLFCVCLFVARLNVNAISNNYTAAIVVDATNGEVLYSYEPDKRIFPASLTKMMTAYVAFDALNKGIIGLNDDTGFVINNAVNRNSKIKDLLYKIAVNSSNSMTNILAEETCGSVNDFVIMMNDFAKKIGMKDTHFVNTNGLYHVDHYSTARDIAKLSIRMVYDFPQYVDFFGTTNFIDENGEYNTKTSQIQEHLAGLEGGKTGYIDASGFNLAVWGKYNQKHLFVVVIGADNKVSRDAVVIKLINLALKNSNILLEKKKYKDDSFIKKMFDFIGINYDEYKTPTPNKRPQMEHKNINNYYQSGKEIISDEIVENDKNSNNYFYKK